MRRGLLACGATAAAFAAFGALLTELGLRALPSEARPFSGPVRARIRIEAPIDEVWSTVADIPGQVRWMPEMKRVRMVTSGPVGKGSIGEATVRIFGIAVTDRVTITTFRPSVAFGIEHHGLFGGRGVIRLRPEADGLSTTVDWEEYLVPPWLPAVGWLVARPIIGHLYQRDLFRLRDLVEATRARVAA